VFEGVHGFDGHVGRLVKVGLTRANLALRDTMATKKKRQTKKSARAWMCVQLGECTGGALVGAWRVTE
jgi:succinate dehydrogenase/fumarate reductase-like Fe-S protein